MQKSNLQYADVPREWTREQKINYLLKIVRNMCRKYSIYTDKVTLDHEDLFQEASIAVMRAVDDYDPHNIKNAKLVTYAITKAHYAILEAFRTYSHTPRSLEEKGIQISWNNLSVPNAATEECFERVLVDPEMDVEGHSLTMMERQRFRGFVHRLPPKQREAVLYYINEDGITYREISLKMRLSETRIYQLIKSASKSMRAFYIAEEVCDERRALQREAKARRGHRNTAVVPPVPELISIEAYTALSLEEQIEIAMQELGIVVPPELKGK